MTSSKFFVSCLAPLTVIFAMGCTKETSEPVDPCSKLECGKNQACGIEQGQAACTCLSGFEFEDENKVRCIPTPSQDAGFFDAFAPIDAEVTFPDASSPPDAGTVPVCEKPFGRATRHDNLTYGTLNERQRLDLIETNAPGPNPTIVWIHGGGWRQGRKSFPIFGEFIERGYNLVGIEYRLSDNAWPNTLLDVKAAIRWLRANAQTYRIDPDRIVVMGSSAGGHLAAFLGTSGGVNEFDEPSLGNENFSSDVNLVVNFYGPTSIIHMDEDAQANQCPANSLCHLCPDSPESMLLDCTPPDCPDRAAKASPITHVDGNEPPFLNVHGTEDCTVPTPQATRLHEALLAANSDSTLIIAQGAGHNVRECLANGIEDNIIEFVELHMRGCKHEKPEVNRPPDAQLNECLYENCPTLAAKCENLPVCVRLETCFQDCFADPNRQGCINACQREVSCEQDSSVPCLSDANRTEVVDETHYPLFQCGRSAGCYPRR